MTLQAAILVALLRLPPFALDAESPDARSRRLADVAAAIAEASHGDRLSAAAAVALGWTETKFAALVQEDRCHEMPRGQRCDGGRALGVWQLHRAACPAAWSERGNLLLQARCAIRLLRAGRYQCGSLSGAFAFYGGRRCSWSGGFERAELTRKIFARL